MSDRINPTVADGEPIRGDLVAVVDESSPANAAGGVAYVVAVAALFDPVTVGAALETLFPDGRRRPFHWEREGRQARSRVIEIATESGVSAAAFYAHVSRRGQVQARREIVSRAALHAASEGVEHLMIEASDVATVGRDQAVLLDTFRPLGGVPYAFDWRTKKERLLWIADAVAGRSGEYVTAKDPSWFEAMVSAGIVTLVQHP